MYTSMNHKKDERQMNLLTNIGKCEEGATATNGRNEPQTNQNLPNELKVRSHI